MVQTIRSTLPLVVAAALAVLVPACSKGGQKPVFPVKGEVRFKTKPAEGALVVFHPVDGDDDPNKPRATVGADGSFELTTYNANDGAPAGEYVVTVRWPAPKKTPFDGEGGDRLGGRYANPKTSKIRFTIGQETTQLPPIELN
jgi:hypothetical protein